MIIQRWQSVLLFISAALMACFAFLSLGQVVTTNYSFNFTSLGFFSEGEPTQGSISLDYYTWYFFMLAITTIVVLLIDIFLYKNLKLQKKVCLVGLLFIVACGAVGGCQGYVFSGDVQGEMNWSAVALCPFIAIVSTILAYNRISADHRLLRSANRLR